MGLRKRVASLEGQLKELRDYFFAKKRDQLAENQRFRADIFVLRNDVDTLNKGILHRPRRKAVGKGRSRKPSKRKGTDN